MTVDYGLLTPQGYKPTVVRVLRLEPKPKIFGRNTVIQAWGVPDGIDPAERAGRLLLQDRPARELRQGGRRGRAADLHAAPARRACPRRRLRSGSPATRAPMIDHLMALDPGGRGIAAFFVRGGATAAAQALRKSRRVLLTTGFAVGPGLPETDGPPGTACLGRALRTLGAEVVYVTDAVAVPPLQAALKVLGEPSTVRDLPRRARRGRWARRGRRARDGAAPAGRAPAHAPGRHRAARPRRATATTGARAAARSPSGTAPLDELFLAAPARIVTVGMGDGGNEMGMGTVRARVARAGGVFAAHRLGGEGEAPGGGGRVQLGRLRHRGRAGPPDRPRPAAHRRGGAGDGAAPAWRRARSTA